LNRADWIVDISHRPRPRDPRLVGRDYSNAYYDFLYYLASELQPARTVELGTCQGHSTVHLALGWPAGTVTTVDCDLRPKTRDLIGRFKNVNAIEGGSTSKNVVTRIRKEAPIDLLFVDTLHEREQVEQELNCYLPMMKSGGIIAFDDVRLNQGMADFWDELRLEKVCLNHLHASGFGIAFAP